MLVQSGTGACPVQQMEELLSNLEAKNEELAEYANELSQLPAASSDESASLVTVITNVYTVCVSVQVEFITIFVEVSEIFSNEDNIKNRECRSGVLRLEASLNQSLSDGGDILLRVSAILNDNRPDIPDALRADLGSCAEDLESLFTATLDLAKNVGLLVESGKGACPVQQMEELLSKLEAKNEELAEYAQELSQLPAASSDESASLVTVITNVYTVCVSVQVEFITIFVEVSEIFSQEVTIENPECRSGVLRLEASLNQSLSDGGDILLRVAAILNDSRPDIPDSLRDDLSRCAADLKGLSSVTLVLAKYVRMLVQSGTGACPVQQMEELLSELEAKNEELAEYAKELSKIPAASSVESVFLFSVITDVYMLCVSTHLEFITIFDEVSHIFSNEETNVATVPESTVQIAVEGVLEKPCRDRIIVLQSSINQSMSDIIQIVNDTIEQIEEKNPDLPDDLVQRLFICWENTSALFNRSLESTEALQELTDNPHSTESCPVDDFEELLKDLTAKATEWQAINDIITGLHPPVRRVKRVTVMEILSQLKNFHAYIIIIYDRFTVIVIHIIQIFTAIEEEENAKTTEIVTTERDTTTEITSTITTMIHKVADPECRSGVLRLEASLNQSLSDGGDILLRVAAILNESRPDLPNSLRDDLSRCAADLERLFTATSDLAKNVGLLVESGTGACPVQQMEELLSELVAKNEELAGYANELSQLPAASSDESASLVSVVTNAYMLCVSVQLEFITIFEEVSEIFSNEETIENPECRSGVLRLEASLNQSLSDGGDILLRVAAILNESRPDIPNSLRDDLSRCAADLERLFTATSDLAKNVGLLVESDVGACPVQLMEELLSELVAKNVELAGYANELSQLPAASSDESASLVSVVTNAYMLCVSVQLEFITIFEQVSEIFSNEETIENPECRSGVLRLEASLNLSLSIGGDILLRVSAILNESRPDLPNSLRDDLSRCAADLERLFTATLDLAKNVGQLVESGTGACPVQQMDELLSELVAKNVELAGYANELSKLPAASSDESTSLVSVITNAYMLCVSVQQEFITIFEQVSEIFSNEETIENPECRSGVLRLEASLNQSLSDGGDILLRVAAILNESRPDLPNSLRDDLSRCAADLRTTFTATSDLAKNVGLLVGSDVGACPVQLMEELLSELVAKNAGVVVM
ncbi:uncharacterized protein LOC122259257 [Penaeus japonicus]|uniref:uncharacterized protein LOC122259257 n=1 Tax=Penaeus japonicus TaxID=27405 RepID=UPI001C7135B4|nr:uncharacterized protein LOC122259257 [Penaeus japonicus]